MALPQKVMLIPPQRMASGQKPCRRHRRTLVGGKDMALVRKGRELLRNSILIRVFGIRLEQSQALSCEPIAIRASIAQA